jgi:hypothetical protein
MRTGRSGLRSRWCSENKASRRRKTGGKGASPSLGGPSPAPIARRTRLSQFFAAGAELKPSLAGTKTAKLDDRKARSLLGLLCLHDNVPFCPR